jgi:F-type H+-transporting ATPase subunit epsilon
MSETSSRNIQCAVVTPERTLLEETADFVVLPLYDGEMGIAPGHSPLVGRLGFGELRLRQGDKTQRLYVEGGFAQVDGKTVAVLTTRAIPAIELDLDKLNADLARLQSEADAAVGTEKQHKLEAVQKTKAQIKIRERLPRRVSVPGEDLSDALAERRPNR